MEDEEDELITTVADLIDKLEDIASTYGDGTIVTVGGPCTYDECNVNVELVDKKIGGGGKLEDAQRRKYQSPSEDLTIIVELRHGGIKTNARDDTPFTVGKVGEDLSGEQEYDAEKGLRKKRIAELQKATEKEYRPKKKWFQYGDLKKL